MTEHIISLGDIEARAPDLHLIVRPVRPQPPEDFEEPYQDSNGVWVVCDNRPPDILNTYKLHGSLGVPGDVLLGKEAVWYPTCLNCGVVRYVADHPERPGYMYERIPSSRMPRNLIRWRRTVVETGVMRVGEITTEQAVMAGFQDTQGRPWWPRTEFRKNWERRWKQAGNPWCEPGSWAWWAVVEEGHHA